MANFHESNQPDVSIVMPIFNKLDLTKICVDSLWENLSDATWELIIVDNGSTDGSGTWLQTQAAAGRLRYIQNSENKGFAQACNVGAAASKGKYILFLNNDMKVLSGWLDPMVTTLDNDQKVGIVGAKLIFPDNTIQHAGVALIDRQKNGTSVLEGTLLSYKKPAESEGTLSPQIMQIVTGACLLIRPEVFHDVGGFDEQYWNGNEDVDLCLKVAEKGWLTVYRPESVVIHYESQSGPQRWAKVKPNIEHFNSVWQNRAQPDYACTSNGTYQRTENCSLRNYVAPRIKWRQSKFKPTNTDDQSVQPKVSVIVSTWNALQYTKLCADSLLAHTDKHHELIFVDNGSRPDTIEYLKKLAQNHNQVKVIYNQENLGFAAGNNVGIAAASGAFICLLNSDTVVTDQWLDKLMAPALAHPHVGLVGPVTNSITGSQCLNDVGYDQKNLTGLAEFASTRAKEFNGVFNTTLWVVGFCLLIRHDLIERIGGLDEGFGQGNYEDTDYCLRAMLASYDSVIAQDCFIHHFGSRSFRDAKVDYSKQITEKFAIFSKKWYLDNQKQGMANINPETLAAVGYLPPLHFHPLPESKSIQISPIQHWEIDRWLAKGEVVFQAGMLAQAADIFRSIMSLSSECSRAESNLACTLWQQAKSTVEPAEAKSMLTTALNILNDLLAREPDNEDALWNLQEIKNDLPAETFLA